MQFCGGHSRIGASFNDADFGSKPKKIRISLFEIAINDESRQQRGDLQNFFIVFSGRSLILFVLLLFF